MIQVVTFKNYYVKSCEYYLSQDSVIEIYSPSSLTKILIESSTFLQCSIQGNHPCVSFGDNGDIVQNKVCYALCKGGGKGELFSSRTDFYLPKFNKIFESTLLYNGYPVSSNPGIYFCNGIVQISKVNISNNYNKVCSGYYMFNYQPQSMVSYTTLDNNTQPEGHVAVHFETPFKLLTDIVLPIVSCNYVRNVGKSSLFYTEISGIISIKQSCVASNRAEYTFYTTSGSIYLDSSYCDNITSFNRNKLKILNQIQDFSEVPNQFELQSSCEKLVGPRK